MNENKQEYLSVTQYAALHNIDTSWVRRLVAQGRIPAIKIGTQWAIKADALPPADARVKSGKYKNWRKKSEDE